MEFIFLLRSLFEFILLLSIVIYFEKNLEWLAKPDINNSTLFGNFRVWVNSFHHCWLVAIGVSKKDCFARRNP